MAESPMACLSAKAILSIAADNFLREQIDCLCIVAPVGQHRRWIELAVPQHLNSAIPVAGQVWVPRQELDRHVMRRSPERILRILAIPGSRPRLRNAFTDALTFLRSGKSMLVFDDSQRSGGSLASALSDEARLHIQSSVPIDLELTDAPLVYCRRCSDPILKEWRSWPQKDPVPLLPLLGVEGFCDRCVSPHADEIPADRIAWVDVHTGFGGLPEYWLLRADSSIEHWGPPYLSEGPCPNCGNRAVLSEHRAEGKKFNCENCGVVDAQ